MLEAIPWPFTRLYDKYPNRFFIKFFKRIAARIQEREISGIILDIGTGPGRLPIEIAKQVENVQVIGIDLSRDMIKMATRNAEEQGVDDKIKFEVASAYNTGLESDSIDLILSTEVIHHLKEPMIAFNEMYRVLKPGGEAWLYDGRRDAAKAAFEETFKSFGMERNISLRLRIVEAIWPRIHTGYKSEVYRSGIIGKALSESFFKNFNVKEEGIFILIQLRK